MSGLFITSSGTGIGKTLVTATLLYQCRIHYRQAMALKPVISGIKDGWAGSDTDILIQAMGRGLSRGNIETISPFAFQESLSPAMAAKAEGKTLDYDALLKVCRDTLDAFPLSFIEGVGGSFVPLVGDKLVADWVKDLSLESVLVVGSYLGAQSHAIATLEAMQARNLPIRAIVVSESDGDDNPDFGATVETIKDISQLPTLALPRQTGPKPWTTAPDLMNIIKGL